MKLLVLFFSLFGLWLLWSGMYQPLLIGLGLASCLLVVFMVKRLNTLDREAIPTHIGWGIFPYWIWLIKEIVVSSLQVSRIILSPRMAISPTMVKVQSLCSDEVGRVIFGNSITMTPGTITTDIQDDGVITVHALTQDGAEGVVTGDMNARVAALQAKKSS